MSKVENYLALTGISSWYWNDWCNNGNDGTPHGMYSYDNLGLICEWDELQPSIQMDEAMSYTVFSGSNSHPLYIFGNENKISGDVYSGSFFCSASLLDINGKLDSVGDILIFCAKDDIKECNKYVDPVKMPDWDNRIIRAAGAYEYTEDDIVKIKDKNIINGSFVTGGNVEISGTSFSGDCYIIANGNITYNVNTFDSDERVVLYSKNGNIQINGTDIDFNGIMYAPNGNISFNTNITNVNGRLFADSFTFSGSQLNVTGSEKDWELIGTDNIITKTYTSVEEFGDGTFDNIETVNEGKLILKKTDDFNGEKVKEYNVDFNNNHIRIKETVSKEFITYDNRNVNVKLNFLSGETSRYELFDEGVTWSQAESKCRNLGGHLATIANEKEWNTVRKIFEEENNGKYHLWLGGFYDSSEREWKWVDGTPFTFTNWDSGEPNREYSNGQYEDYLMCYRVPNPFNGRSVAYKWNDLFDNGLSSGIFTTGNYCYICEWDDVNTAENLSFSTTVNNIKNVDTEKISPKPVSITEKSDGSAVIVWNNIAEEITIPFISAEVAEAESLLLYNSVISSENVFESIDPTSVQVKAYGGSDQEYLPIGSWETVYDSECDGAIWSEVFWNGILYDDSQILVQIAVSDNINDLNEWIDVINHAALTNTKGRYVKIRLTEKASSIGKSPELHDISIYSKGAISPGYTNYPPVLSINNTENCFCNQYVFLNSEAYDDSFNNKLIYEWTCESENAEFKESDKPYARVKFSEPGDYLVNLEVSDGTSSTNLKKIMTVINRPDTGEQILVPERDTTKPVVHITKDTEDLVKPGDKITISVTAEDNDKIKESVLKINGEVVSVVDGKYVIYAEEGIDYFIEYSAEDESGNIGTDTMNISVTAFSGETEQGPYVQFVSHRVLVCGQPSDFIFIGDSTTEKLSVNFNGEYAEPDENGLITYIPKEKGEVLIDVHAENSDGKSTDFQLKAEAIDVYFYGKANFKEDESAEFTVQSSDNYTFADRYVLIDGERYEIDENGKAKANKLEIGEHKAVLYLVNDYNEIINSELAFRIVDTTPPVATISLNNTDVQEGDNVTADIFASDNAGIKEVKVTVDGNECHVSEDNTVIIENISSGKHIIEVTVIDNEGNGCRSSYEFIVSDENQCPLSLKATAEYDNNKIISVNADVRCVDDNYTLYGSINDEKIEFSGNTAKYQAEAGKEYIITVTADNGYTKAVSTMKISIPEEQPEYKFKIEAVADRTEVNVNEPVKINIKTNSFTGSYELNYSVNGGKISLEDGCFTFLSSASGNYIIKFTALDSQGRTAEDTVVITVGRTDDGSEVIEEYISPYTPEISSRTLIVSEEPTETKMTVEMADLADHLKTPLAVYEFLYNTIDIEFYSGSRKGAIGAYEMKGANDVDSASLLIAMLRYLGYEAEYVTGKVEISDAQLMQLTGADTSEKALDIFKLQLYGLKYKRVGNIYEFPHTWVRAKIDNKTYDLDISFKEYCHVNGIYELAADKKSGITTNGYSCEETGKLAVDIKEYLDSLKVSEETEINVTGKKIVNRKFSTLCPFLLYSVTEEIEVVHDINKSAESKSNVISTDHFTISADSKYGEDGESISVSAPEAYLNSVKLAYTNKNGTTDKIYGSKQPVYLSLYINGQKNYTWDFDFNAGEMQNVYITVFSSGASYTESKPLIVGSVNAIVFDFQTISPQSLKTAYDSSVLSENEKQAINEDKTIVYNESYIGDYLELMGNMYFADADIADRSIAGLERVFTERTLSYGFFSYNPGYFTDSFYGLSSGSQFDQKGYFNIDIIGNYKHCIAYDEDSRNSESYILASGFMDSYYESYVLDVMTGVESISTAKVFDICSRNNIDIKLIHSGNIDDVNKLEISQEDKNAVIAEARRVFCTLGR